MTVQDIRPPLDSFFSTFPGAVEATVTPKGGQPISTVVVWEDPSPSAGPDFGSLNARGSDQIPNLRPQLDIRRDHVANLPVGSTVLAPARGGQQPRLWRVERVNEIDPEVFSVVVEEA